MIGHQSRDQLEFFVCGSLRDLVPDDHVLACVDRVLDLGWLAEDVADLYAVGTGRPGVAPEAAVRLMLAGFLLGIVHDRRLLREAQVNLAIRWFAGYGLHERLPDHSSLTRIRQRWGAERFRRIFERTVQSCMAAGIAKGEVVHDQNPDLQRDALEAACCERVIVDTMSGAARPGLAQLKDILRAGDTLVVWRLDRLGRSLKDLIAWVGWLDEREIGLRSLYEAIDTTTPTGKLTFHIFGALAEFERALIRDRTQAGLAAARARGRKGGRRPTLSAEKRALAVRLYNEREMPITSICRMMGISKPTLYSYVRAISGITEGPPAN